NSATMPLCRRTVTVRNVASYWIESPRARAILATGTKRRPPRCCAELFGPASVRPLTIITAASGKLLLCAAGSVAYKFLLKPSGLVLNIELASNSDLRRQNLELA